ncbi:MAG: 4Fe-4S dicluster domain-containing protein [Thioalkalivibrio sp.]|nr:4Fe-4S dicluster domain-containing protein [Thioalkalivibrio sp.]
MGYGMVIDQQLCVGCAACTIACKIENNTPVGINWCDKITRTSGTFPAVRYEYVSTMCNHCQNAPCVNACPTQAMYKDKSTGLTLHDPKKCIGCKACIVNCPYGVINFNWETPHQDWAQDNRLAEGCFSPKEMVEAVGGKGSPHGNPERGTTGKGLREELGTKPRVIYIRDYKPQRRFEPARPAGEGQGA